MASEIIVQCLTTKWYIFLHSSGKCMVWVKGWGGGTMLDSGTSLSCTNVVHIMLFDISMHSIICYTWPCPKYQWHMHLI